MTTLKKLGITVLVLAGYITSALGVSSCQAGNPGKVENITIGEITDVVNAPIDIASNQKFFAANGLSANIKTMDSGVTVSKALLNGEIDFALVTEYAAVGSALGHEAIRIIACVNKFESVYIMGRKDRGIEKIADLQGKKIGVTRKAIPEFYLGRFLDLNSLNIRDVSLVDIKPPQVADALIKGDADAVVIRQPFARQLKAQLADKIVIWPAQSNQFAFIVIACRNDWLAQHEAVAQRFLKAVEQAGKYMMSHQNEAKAIMRDELKIDMAYIEEAWRENQFSLTLDLSLIIAMNDEARWMINNSLTTEKTIPDFYDYLYSDSLRAVKPDAVNISR